LVRYFIVFKKFPFSFRSFNYNQLKKQLDWSFGINWLRGRRDKEIFNCGIIFPMIYGKIREKKKKKGGWGRERGTESIIDCKVD